MTIIRVSEEEEEEEEDRKRVTVVCGPIDEGDAVIVENAPLAVEVPLLVEPTGGVEPARIKTPTIRLSAAPVVTLLRVDLR